MVEFKKLEISDLAKIQRIAYETWPNTFGQLLPREQIDYMLQLIYNEESLMKQIQEKGHNFMLAEKNNQPLGFSSYEINYNAQPKLMIHKLYILPTAQGLGIGTKFINMLSKLAVQNSNNQLRLKVYIKNDKAIEFYEKYGFRKVGTESTDIGNNYEVSDYVMIKDL
jgi:diamine N-acetyltransferase